MNEGLKVWNDMRVSNEPRLDYTIFLSVTTVTVSDYAILTHKILLCHEQETCQTIR